MPKITIDHTTRRLANTTGQRFTSEDDFGGQIGRSLQGLGQTTSSIGETIQREAEQAAAATYVADQTIQTATQLSSIIDEERAAGLDGYSDRVLKRADEYLQSVENSAPNKYAQDQMRSMRVGRLTNLASSEIAYVRRARQDQYQATYQNGLEQLENRLMRDPDYLQAAIQEHTILTSTSEGLIDPASRTALTESGQEALTTAYAFGLAKNNPHRLLSELNGGAFDDLDPSTVQALSRDADRQIKIQQAQVEAKKQEAHAALYTDLRMKAVKGNYTETEAWKALENGEIKFNEYQALTNLIDGYAKGLDNTTASTVEVAAFLDGQLELDITAKSDRRKLDTYYNNVIQPQLDTSQDPAEATQLVVTFISDTGGYIPTAVRTNIENTFKMGSPQQQLEQAQFLESIASVNPDIYDSFSVKTQAQAQRLAAAAEAGVDAKEAVNRARTVIIEPHTQEYKLRERQFDKEFPEFDSGSVDAPGLFDFAFAPDIPPAMEREWRTTAKLYAIEHDLPYDKAAKNAYRQIQSQYQVTNINGEAQWMKFPPSMQYPQYTDAELTEVFKRTKTTKGYPDEAYLVTDPRSVKGKASYFVGYVDDFGIDRLEPWEPDFTILEASKEREKLEAISEVEETRQEVLDLQSIGSTEWLDRIKKDREERYKPRSTDRSRYPGFTTDPFTGGDLTDLGGDRDA